MDWISVEDRLPELKESYKNGPLTSGQMLIFNGHFVTIGEYSETFKKRERRRVGTFLAKIYVSHWMPLPEPPK